MSFGQIPLPQAEFYSDVRERDNLLHADTVKDLAYNMCVIRDSVVQEQRV